MHSETNDTQSGTAECPFRSANAAAADLSQDDVLLLPKHRRIIQQYLTDETGSVALHIYYGDKEILFDEPELFSFGEALAKHGRFTAGEAVGWGAGYTWPRIRELLQALIDEGVLVRSLDRDQEEGPAGDSVVASLLPPAVCPVARTWDECEAITQEIAGHAVESGYLELIMPIFRVAHIVLDADQRQIGEANVFPQALRLDVPTEWRTCNLPGSRYQSELPMNVTAMRVMRAHWAQMMAAALQVRAEYLRRFPEADGAWTVGHVERLSVAVLALPSYQLMRRNNRIENGELHPALSSLFRVTDGVRMVMHLMLLFPANEPTCSPDKVLTVDEILDYAERNNAFHSDYGVCAGPRSMVRELIQILLEGRGNADYRSVPLDVAVQAALDDVQDAVDYGLLGLRAFATVFVLWTFMGRSYEEIGKIIESEPLINTPVMMSLRAFMEAQREPLMATYLAHETWRASRERVYADMYQQCGRGLPNFGDAPGLDVVLSPVWTDAHRRTEAALQVILRQRLETPNETHAAFIRTLSAGLMNFLLREQAVLRTATAVQSAINRLLGRDEPRRAFGAAEIHVYNQMQGPDLKPLPYLIHEMERLLGIQIDLDGNSLTISSRDAAV
jgi:hypothetical protein